MQLLIMKIYPLPFYLALLGPNILLNTYSQAPSAYIPLSMSATKFHTL
jgi:hypothetical protein